MDFRSYQASQSYDIEKIKMGQIRKIYTKFWMQ